eukprot:gnl/MRDRNA2_/MRDRNA2_79515_c0_seq2.p1 gnl/MRDRNA2_/MRDRNA2_79515_c0~~gnl/MRDRNA2_/MRDRNA2_79515_c0_seq2.p1  ORF type:complete len:255 (+),score=36.63 gnl/MRDRNA2_/MRDRNA2_79515_c0_seq2:127-891(+)
MKAAVPGFGAHWYNTTEDGFEEMIGVNHISQYLLTRLLESRLRSSAPARVVVVSSIAHQNSFPEGIRFDHWRKQGEYDDGISYGQSKLANILFAQELAERLQGTGVTSYSVHPGIIKTKLFSLQDEFFSTFTGITKFLVDVNMAIFNLAMFDPAGGALTQLYAAASPDLDNHPEFNGKYFTPCVTPAQPVHPKAYDRSLQKELWEKSEQAVQPFLTDPARSQKLQEQNSQVLHQKSDTQMHVMSDGRVEKLDAL